MNRKNILVTGPPQCGKTTLIERVTSRIGLPLTGFFTREIREKGRRRGFNVVTVGGTVGVLAHEDIRSRIKVGKYHVNLADLEAIAVPSMVPTTAEEVIVIDEIGKMECHSGLFRNALIRALDSPNAVIGSIALRGGDFIRKIKDRADVEIVMVSEKNRDHLADSLASRMPARGS